MFKMFMRHHVPPARRRMHTVRDTVGVPSVGRNKADRLKILFGWCWDVQLAEEEEAGGATAHDAAGAAAGATGMGLRGR